MKTLLRAFIVLVLLVVIAGGGIGLSFLNTAASEDGSTAVFEVRPHESLKVIAQRLEDQRLIRNAKLFELYGRLTHVGSKMRVGEYAIRKDAKPKDVIAVITSGKSIEYSITIQEGFNIFEIADVVQKRGVANREVFLALVRDKALIKELLGEDAPSLEGYLFPETYNITKFTGPVALVHMMVARFKENYEKVKSLTAMKRHDLVTLASIIEKETGAPEERPLISSVFYNRMKINMRMQTDPTVIYGTWEKTGSWDGSISKSDLLTPNRYNTYTFTGLPYGPIANPGLEAMRAAAQPSQSDFLFFVSKNDGTHVFSKDLNGHVKAVAKFQLDKKARAGKSWRDLKNRDAKKKPLSESSTASPRTPPQALPKASSY